MLKKQNLYGKTWTQPRSNSPLSPGFTLVELLVVIGIIALMISILLPTLSKVRDSAKTLQCLAVLRQWGNAQHVYSVQFKGWAVPDFQDPTPTGAYPASNNRKFWRDNPGFRKALGVPEFSKINGNMTNRFPLAMLCPLANKPQFNVNADGADPTNSYGYNEEGMYQDNSNYYAARYRGERMGKVKRAAEKMMFADAMDLQVNQSKSNHYNNPRFPGFDEWRDNSTASLYNNYVAYRHSRNNEKINVLFWDGHAETKLRWDIATANTWSDDENKSHPNFRKVWDLSAN